MKTLFVSALTLLLPIIGFSETNQENSKPSAPSYRFDGKKLLLSDKEWKEKLSPAQYLTLRKSKADAPYSGAYCYTTKKGTYLCAGCELPVYSSETKYDSGTGWATFFAPIHSTNISFRKDSHYKKYEIVCSRCEGHLGEIFKDGPPPTWMRHCVDSTAVKFVSSPDQAK